MAEIRRILGKLFGRILGVKLRYRLLLIYLVGGVAPVSMIAAYLINGTRSILLEQAENQEVVEVDMICQQTHELLATVTMVSRNFLFDEKLEAIALKEYSDYREMVEDYRNYTAFTDYGTLFNNFISWMSVYMENETIRGNAHFVKVSDPIRAQSWYDKAKANFGRVCWQYLPGSTGAAEGLGLTRLLRTEKGEEVGVLALYLRQERLDEILKTRDYGTMIVLNGEIMAAAHRVDPEMYGGVYEGLREREDGKFQEQIRIGQQEYMMTCSAVKVDETGDRIQIVGLRSYRDILEQVNRQSRRSLLFFLGSVGASVALISAFSWSFGKRVSCFHEQMQKAAAGKFDLVETIGGNDEISELYNYLGIMITESRRLLAEVYTERIRAEKLKNEQKDAEYKMLASQINPHFLYNTLETIRMKARINKQYDIERLVKMLAKILRKNLRAGSQDVTLQAETELVACYLEIQKYRFGERIQYKIDLEEGLEEYPVFPFLLQPLVENAMIHGLETKEGIGHIELSAVRRDGLVLVTVSDDGVGMEEETLNRLRDGMDMERQGSAHIGVGNVHRRVKLRFGAEYGAEICSAPGRGTRIVIRMPEEGQRAEAAEARGEREVQSEEK